MLPLLQWRGKKGDCACMTEHAWTTRKAWWGWKVLGLFFRTIWSEGKCLKGKGIRKECWSARMHQLITLNSSLSLPEFFLFFFGNNLLTSLRPQLSSVTQITRCCIPLVFSIKRPTTKLVERERSLSFPGNKTIFATPKKWNENTFQL